MTTSVSSKRGYRTT